MLERSVFARGGSYEDRARAFAGTISSDTGHAVHPQYAERHDQHTTRGPTAARPQGERQQPLRHRQLGHRDLRHHLREGRRPLQSFVSNNSMPCGTTIGPITAARHGIRTVDIGVAILSMHSARRTLRR